MPKLDERISALEGRLQQLKARQQKLVSRQRTMDERRTRKDDIRRKILLGAILLARVEQGRFPEGELRSWLDKALTRADDRALFGLPALPVNVRG